jgi:large exoprotein involved in heme utilization and adhesion
MDGAGTTINASANDVGRGGDVVVSVQQASLSGGATIITQTNSPDFNAPPGPTVTVQGLEGAGSAAESVVLSGSGSGIVADSFGFARAGEVVVHSKTVSLTDGAVILGGTPSTSAAGSNVIIEANSVEISGGSHISSQASNLDAGQVTIIANQLTMDHGSIETSTSGPGRGGDVGLTVGNANLTNGARVDSSTSDTGRAGDVTMTVGSLTLTNHAEITSSSTGIVADPGGSGDAGNITIQSGSTVVMNNSRISAEASQASGGSFTITAPEMIRLTNSRISTAVFGGTGDGGNITIDPQFVILQNSQIIAQANAGSGGQINVTAGVFLADPNSVVDASSKAGPQGTVNIQSPVQNLGEQLTPLPQQFSSAAALLAQQCAARVADGKFSTFVIAGREGLPVEPGGFLASPSLTAELLGASLSGLYPHRPIPAVTGSFPEYDARPIQLAKYGDACRQ